MPRVLSLFSGVGTFDYGFQQAGWDTIGFCEFDPKAREVLKARFPDVPIHDDIRTMDGMQFGPADVVMGGFPCQDVSVAGLRAGMAEGSETRSSLFFEAMRVVREMRERTAFAFPRFVLIENVPGLLSSNGGRDFAAVLAAMVGGTVHVPPGGWRNAGVAFGPHGQGAWRVLDSQFFGVPQRRRRIFLVADFGGERAGEILFESESLRGHPQPRRKAGEEVAACLTTGTGKRYDAETETLIPLAFDHSNSRIHVSADIAPTLLAGSQEEMGRGRVAIAFDYKASVQRDPMCGPISPTLEAQDKTAVVVKYGNGQSQRIQVNPTISPTLGVAGGDAGGGGQKAAGLYAFPPTYAVRRLTPTECERLQSMPDGWTDVDGMADSHRYRFMGNGGTARKLKWIAERMKGALL